MPAHPAERDEGVMSTQRNRNTSESRAAPAENEPQEAAEPRPPSADRVPVTRTSAAWLAICTAAVILVVLIVFMLQNTGSVEVTFLWLTGSLPLALALLIAAVGAAILTMIVGVARMTQLRRRIRRDRAR
jgi:uncharacterized integral membrane protein